MTVENNRTKPAGQESNTYALTLTLGHVLFQVFGTQAHGDAIEYPPGAGVRQLWPRPDLPIDWPLRTLSDADVDEVANIGGAIAASARSVQFRAGAAEMLDTERQRRERR